MMNEEENIEEEIQETEELYEKLVLIIDKGQEPLRIDKFLMSRIEGATRNKIQQGIDNEMVLVNEKPVKNNYKVKAFDKIVVFNRLFIHQHHFIIYALLNFITGGTFNAAH